MKEMTKQFLETAFAGESMAHMKYTIFAEEAEKKGLIKLSKLFKAIAYAEFVHAKNHFRILKKLSSNMADNVQTCIDGETFEIEEMYPVYKKAAEFQGESDAEKSAYYALEAEKVHAEMYKKAKELVEKGEDYSAEKIFICPVCGYTVEDEAPDKCPICGTPKDKFVEF
ncbi:MAG: rubrerythrin family protein [Thermosipho sp. (in: Bacteria)]|nr:rubrerythrin family protein [Thermosipho sp. (in: thermotogales)]